MKFRTCNRFLTIIFIWLLLPGCTPDIPVPRIDPLPADAVILAFGDSLTYGTGARREGSYPAVLQKLSGRKVINAGKPGEMSGQGKERLPRLIEVYEPELIIICHGGNDILRKKDLNRMESNLRQMIGMAQAQDIPVVLMAVPEFGLFLSPAGNYRTVAESTGVFFIEDLIPAILADNALKSDAIHPNEAGYKKMAETIHALLQETGAL